MKDLVASRVTTAPESTKCLVPSGLVRMKPVMSASSWRKRALLAVDGADGVDERAARRIGRVVMKG